LRKRLVQWITQGPDQLAVLSQAIGMVAENRKKLTSSLRIARLALIGSDKRLLESDIKSAEPQVPRDAAALEKAEANHEKQAMGHALVVVECYNAFDPKNTLGLSKEQIKRFESFQEDHLEKLVKRFLADDPYTGDWRPEAITTLETLVKYF